MLDNILEGKDYSIRTAFTPKKPNQIVLKFNSSIPDKAKVDKEILTDIGEVIRQFYEEQLDHLVINEREYGIDRVFKERLGNCQFFSKWDFSSIIPRPGKAVYGLTLRYMITYGFRFQDLRVVDIVAVQLQHRPQEPEGLMTYAIIVETQPLTEDGQYSISNGTYELDAIDQASSVRETGKLLRYLKKTLDIT